jgi:hypothetical protein
MHFLKLLLLSFMQFKPQFPYILTYSVFFSAIRQVGAGRKDKQKSWYDSLFNTCLFIYMKTQFKMLGSYPFYFHMVNACVLP